MMELLPASPGDAIKVSMAMVDEAEIYIGVFAYRYGYQPPGYNLSITEMEYRRAQERKLPTFIFLMAPEHNILRADVEFGEGEAKLERLKSEIKERHCISYFSSPMELRGNIINSLANWRFNEMAGGHL